MIDKGIKTGLYTGIRKIGELTDSKQCIGFYSSKRSSGQIGDVPRFCDSRMARHSEHRR